MNAIAWNADSRLSPIETKTAMPPSEAAMITTEPATAERSSSRLVKVSFLFAIAIAMGGWLGLLGWIGSLLFGLLI